MHGTGDLLLVFGGAATGLLALTTLLRWLFRAVAVMNKTWDLVSKELQPNGGGSTHDRIREMQQRLSENSYQLREQRLLWELHLVDPYAHVNRQPLDPPREDEST